MAEWREARRKHGVPAIGGSMPDRARGRRGSSEDEPELGGSGTEGAKALGASQDPRYVSRRKRMVPLQPRLTLACALARPGPEWGLMKRRTGPARPFTPFAAAAPTSEAVFRTVSAANCYQCGGQY